MEIERLYDGKVQLVYTSSTVHLVTQLASIRWKSSALNRLKCSTEVKET